MFSKFKKILGIEGLKLDLILPDHIEKTSGVVKGQLVLESLTTCTIRSMDLMIYEKYERGRGKSKKVNDYIIGKMKIDGPFAIEAESKLLMDFSLEFIIAKSEMDEKEESSMLLKGFVKAAKWFSKVSSEYRLEIEAKVDGTRLNPFKSFPLNLV